MASPRKSEDSWLPIWPDEDPNTAGDHDSYESARNELIEELTCRGRERLADGDFEGWEEYHDAIEDIRDWPATDSGAWSIELSDGDYYIEHVEGGAYK